jgi:glycogen operon protein
MLGEFAQRFTGSPDLYENDYRSPTASINFITAHDGFTLHDLVSYNEKHNEANGEDNNDGESHNRSWNCGAEGPTDNPGIIALRQKQKRNFLTTLFISQGVPMIVAGDEIGRTQKGNNNAYCQDNEISWLDWTSADKELLEFTRRIIALRNGHPVFRRRRWFQGNAIRGINVEDIAWFLPNGGEMSEENWNHDYAKSLGVYMNGKGIHTPGPKGEIIIDDHFYVIFNGHHDQLKFKLPHEKYGKQWFRIVDTAKNLVDENNDEEYGAGYEVLVEGRSVVILKQPKFQPKE